MQIECGVHFQASSSLNCPQAMADSDGGDDLKLDKQGQVIRPVSTMVFRGSSVSCFHCHQPGHFGYECHHRGGSSADAFGAKKCYRCGVKGHFARECPTTSLKGPPPSQMCFKCQEEGHIARNCPQNGPERSLSYQFRPSVYGVSPRVSVCFNCHISGHYARDCVKPRKEGLPESLSPQLCFKCNKPGHIAKFCF